MTTASIPNHDTTRLYPIKGRDEMMAFIAGRTRDGRQVLLGILDKELLIALFFNADGDFLRYDFFPVPWDPNLHPVEHGKVLQDAARRWMTGLGMTPGDIRVKHFAFPEWRIGTAVWPLSMFDEVASLTAAGKPLEDEFQIEWQEQGRYVLHWGREHWMDGDGEIGAT